jgi:hypothetical protein
MRMMYSRCICVLFVLMFFGCGEAEIIDASPTDIVQDGGNTDVSVPGTCQGKCGDNLVAGGCSCAADCNQGGVPCCDDYMAICNECLNAGGCCASDADCESTDPCQTGTCTEAGSCSYGPSTDVCWLDTLCVAAGEAHPDETCTVCEQQDRGASFVQVANKTACDDDNACTENDQCNDHGQCLGKLVLDCCTSDAFCNTLEACTVAFCDLATNTCKVKPAEACCDEGVCCDTANGAVMSAGKQCGNEALESQYQCNGQNIDQNQAYAGCDGLSEDGCSTDPQYWVSSDWMTMEACPANTQCTLVNLVTKPTCEKPPPAEECMSASECTAVQQPCSNAQCIQGQCKYNPLPKGLKCGSVVLETTYQCQNGNVYSQIKYAACDGITTACLGNKLMSLSELFQTCGPNETCKMTNPTQPGICQTQCDASKPCCEASGTFSPVGTACPNIFVAPKFQCSSSGPGGAVQKKQGYAGCTGDSEPCSSVSMYVVYDDWQTEIQCGGNQVCKEASSPMHPGTCVTQWDCLSGETQPCGNCGIETCGAGGQWGTCQGEGVCVPGEVGQGEAAFCDVCSERSCTDQCQWALDCVLSGNNVCEWNKGTNFQYCNDAETEWQFCLKPEQWNGDYCTWAPCAPK